MPAPAFFLNECMGATAFPSETGRLCIAVSRHRVSKPRVLLTEGRHAQAVRAPKLHDSSDTGGWRAKVRSKYVVSVGVRPLGLDFGGYSV